MAKFDSFKPALRAACAALAPRTVLEWGPGESTVLIARSCPNARIVSIEHSSKWHQSSALILKKERIDNVQLHLVRHSLAPGRSEGYVTFPLRLALEGVGPLNYDLIFIDGRSRCDCLAIASQLLADGGIVILHDSERRNYDPGCRFFSQVCYREAGTIVLSHGWEVKQRFLSALFRGYGNIPRLAPFVPVTICVLLYGDYLDLAQRCIESIRNRLPDSAYELRVGMNAVSESTRSWIESVVAGRPNVRVFASSENVFKYPMMRKMFYASPITTEWVIWFDDDSHVTSDEWFAATERFIREGDYDYIGKPYFQCLKPGQVKWISEAPWYRGKPHRVHKREIPKIDFVTGGYWLMKSEALKALDWPDRRLQNNGGDVMLGEAAYQAGYRTGKFWSGVAISDHGRRGASQRHPGT